MYWWKVTLDKTGAILSVEQVAERSKGGKLVCFVEALDKAGACEEAKSWFDQSICKICLKSRATIFTVMSRDFGRMGYCVGCVPEFDRREAERIAAKAKEVEALNHARRDTEERYDAAEASRLGIPKSSQGNSPTDVARGAFNRVGTAMLIRIARTYDQLGPGQFRRAIGELLNERGHRHLRYGKDAA